MDEQLKNLIEGAKKQGATDNDIKKIIDMYIADQKKKGSSEFISQEKSGESPTRPIQQGTSSDTEPPMGTQVSGGLGGQTGSPFQSIDPFGGKGAVGAIISEQQKTQQIPIKKTYSYPERKKLYPSEDKFFKENPYVGGMAAADNSVIINPYSPLSDEVKDLIKVNETARLAMRNGYPKPTFDLTPEQKKFFSTIQDGKPYSEDLQDIRETIVGRILSGDPSAGNVTPEQKKYAEGLRRVININNKPSESYAVQVFKKAKSEVDENVTEERLLEEKNQSGFLNYLGQAAKSIWNVTGTGLSSINEALGGTKDYFTIDEYKPLQEEKKQAKRELEKEGLPATNDNIQKRAEDIFRANDKRNQLEKRIDANLPEDYDRQGIWKELKLDNLKKNSSLKEAVISADIYKGQIKEFESYYNTFKNIPREQITQEQVDKYNELLGNAKESLEGLKYLDQKFPKILEEVKSSDELLDVFKYNYNDYEKHLSNIKNFAKGIAGGTVKLMEETARYLDEKTGMDTDVYGFREGNIKMANEVIDEASEDREQFIKYKAKDISNFSDVGSFMAGLGTEQLPVYATLAIAPELGVGLLGAGTGGEQFRTMEIEETQPFAKKTSFGQKLATAYLYGGAETLFERLGTVSVLKNIEKSIAKASNPSRKLIQDGAIQEVSRLGKQFGYNFGLEGGTEYLTAEAQIAADRYVAGKEISGQQANERRYESFVAGGLMGGGMTILGGVWGGIAQNARLYSDNKDIKKTKEILSQIEKLSDEIKNNPNLTQEEKVTVYKKMNELTNQSFDIVSKNAKKGKDFSAKETDFLVDINIKQAELKAKLQEIKDSNFSKEQKETFINELKDEYSKLEEKRNTTLQGNYNKLTELPSSEVIRLKDKAARELMKELNPDGTKTITINDAEINKRAIQLLESETKAPVVEDMSVNAPEAKTEEVKPAIESPIELKEGEELVDVKQDKKGNTYTYVAETSEKDGVKTTKFKFNRSDKSSDQRASSGVDADKVLDKYGYEIPADEIPEGAEISEINEIREGEKTTGATVTFKDPETGNTFKGEILLKPKSTEVKVEEVKPTTSGQRVSDVLNRPATLESFGGTELEAPLEGNIYQDGQRVIFEDNNNKTYDLGNIDEISYTTVEELGIKPQKELMSVTPEGKIKVGDNTWNIQTELPNNGVEYDSDGNVKAVSLKDDNGKTVMYEGQIAEDIAYQTLLNQTQTAEQRQAINEILENDEELNRQLREAEEAAAETTGEVVEPSVAEVKAEAKPAELATEEIAPSEIETTLDEVITPASNNIKEQIARAKKAISKFLPNIEIVYHTTAESFQAAVGDNLRGYYDPATKKIHINGSNATKNTVSHEVFHAVILKYISSDKQATDLTNRMFKALAKSIKNNPNLLKDINKFAESYSKGLQSEEKLAEVLGYLASEYETLPDVSKNIIQKWIENIAKMVGIKKFTDQEVVDFMNTIATKVAYGQEITEADVKAINQGSSTYIAEPTVINRYQKVKEEKVKVGDHKLSFVKKSDLIDMNSLMKEISDKKEKVWFWVADQLGRGDYYDSVIDGEHYLDAGPSFALDPENRSKNIIWATGKAEKEITKLIDNSDYIFIISGSPLKSKLFNKSVIDIISKRAGDFNSFKKNILNVSKIKPLNDVLSSVNSWEELRDTPKRKEFLLNVLNQADKNTPLKKELEKYNSIIDLNELRDGFYADNNFELNDIMLVLKPTEFGGKSNHSTYENNILGEVIGVPDIKVNAFDILPSEIKDKYKGELGKSQQQQAVAPYGIGVKLIERKQKQISPDNSSNYANMTEDGKGNFVFYHFGPRGIGSIDPKKYGSNKGAITSKPEVAAMGRVGGMSQFYTMPEFQESNVSGDKYMIKVPMDRVYDFNTDPENFYDKAKEMFKAKHPDLPFTANDQLAYITKLAEKAGYDMTVAEWNDMSRAQSTKALKPMDTQVMDGNTISKPFNENYESNATKGFEPVVPISKEAKLKDVYQKINAERNAKNRYDSLYSLAEDFPKLSQDKITDMIESSDISQEMKDAYAEALAYEPGARMSGRKQKSPIDTAVETAKRKGFNDKEIADYLVGKGYTRAQATNAILRYNDVTAKKLRKEDSVFTKEGRNKIITFLDQVKRRALSAKSFLPKSVFLAKDKIESNIKAEAKRASYLVDDFNKLVKNYDGDLDVLQDEFDKYLRGDQKAVLPDEFKVVAGKMRMHIDNLSQMLLRTGAVSVSQAEKIASNLGKYINRSYQVFDKKDWAKQVKDEMKEAARVDLRNMYRAEAESKAKQTGMDADIILEDFINKKIDELINREDAATFLGIGKTGSKNLSILKQKNEDIPLSIRQLMGEYTDASQNYARTVLKIATLAENARFLQSARESGMGVFFFNENDPNRPKEFNTKIAGENSDTMSPLNGLYTTPEIAKAFAQKIGTGDAIEAALGTELGPIVRSVYETYMKALSSVKWLKTIGSVATHAKNVTGNLWFMLSNGYYNPKKYVEAFRVLKNSSNEELRDKLDEYIRVGIIDQSAALGEIKAMFADADFETAIENRLKKNPFQKAKAGVRKIGQKMTTAYQLEDDFFKIISYESEKARYSNASFDKPFDQLTAEQQNIVKEKASEITKNILPNYARIPGLVKLLKVVPVAGTFVSFQAEAYRTAWNTVALAADELRSDNKKVKAIGAKRLAGIASSQAAKYGLMALIGTVISGGDDDDEDDKLKKNAKLFVAPWSKDSDLVLVDYGNGKMSYIDFSASDPHGGIKKAYNAAMSGNSVTESFTNGLNQLLDPFVKEDILLNTITDIKNNENSYGGKLYNESDTEVNKINAIMGRVYKSFEPGSVTTVKKVVGSDDVRNELAGQLTGYKIITVDVDKQLSFKMKDLKDKTDEAKRLYNSAFYKFEDGKITEKELNAAYNQANKSQKETYKKMTDYMKAASFFGVEDRVIDDAMEGIGKGVVNDLWYGDIPDMKQKQVKLTDAEFRAKYGEKIYNQMLRGRELIKKGAR